VGQLVARSDYPLFDLDRLLLVLKFTDPWQIVKLPCQTCPELG